MQYRKLGNTGMQVSALGFGAMRLPDTPAGDHVDEESSLACFRRAFELGVNYVDTAFGYCHRESEIVVGKALKGWRDKVYLSTKNPHSDRPADEWRATLDKQLKKLDVDYLDVYHMHGIGWELFEQHICRPGGALEGARKAQSEGLFRHLAFSFHDTPESLVKLIETGEYESVTLQYNLLDRANEEGMALARERGMGVVVMGPVGGGRLGTPAPDIQRLIPGGTRSTAEMALRFVLANPNVSCAISGMSTLAMVEENAAVGSRSEPLSGAERQAVAEALEERKRLAELYCTGCNYCMPCEQGVAIPHIFALVNTYRLYGLKEWARKEYARLGAGHWRKWMPASECIECGKCEEKCPQKIEIIKQLKEAHKLLSSDEK